MDGKPLVFGLLLLGTVLNAGCGDGCCSSNSKAVAHKRAVATIRITRATFAVAGFGRRITRAASQGMGNRIGMWLSAIRQTRDGTPTPPTPAQDMDTGLYYMLSINLDGSGRQDLFQDTALQKPAGAFTWTAPQWTNGHVNNYPATIQTVYQVTAGEFAGEHGTIVVTAADATGNNGEMKIDLTDAQKEHCVSDFTIVNGVVSAEAHCTLDDDSTYDVIYFTTSDDEIDCTTTFPDGGSESVSLSPDGSATETYVNPSGQTEATGNIQPDGVDTIQYDDGSSETVDVDTDSTNDRTGQRHAASSAAGYCSRFAAVLAETPADSFSYSPQFRGVA